MKLAQKEKAQLLVKYALTAGLLTRPEVCEDCGRHVASLHGHHENYENPLVINWLCQSCHSERHQGTSKNTGISPLMTAKQVAKLLGVTRIYVYQLIKAGKLEALKVGRRRLITDSSFKVYRDLRRERGYKLIDPQLFS